MTRSLKMGASIAVLLCGVTAAAAPRHSEPASFTPEIVYGYYTRSYSDVRLSNREGTAALLVYRAGPGIIGNIDLAPASRRMLAFVERGSAGGPSRLRLQTWQVNSTTGAITLDPLQTLYSSRSLFEVDFSPDGNSIAFGVLQPDGKYSIEVLDLATGFQRQLAAGLGGPWDLTWSSDGAFVYYHVEATVDGVGGDHVYRIAAAGGAPERIATERNIESMDAARGSAGATMLVSVWRPELGETFPIGSWDGVTLDGTRAGLSFYQPKGIDVHYSCDNRSFLYREFNRQNNGPMLIYNIDQNTNAVFSKDSNIRRTDWNNCA